MGREVTDTKLGKDASLIDLNRESFMKIFLDLKEDQNVSFETGCFL
jgi:hypothetical protein